MVYSDLHTPIVILEMEQRFSLESCIRGFHVSRDDWNSNLQETLSCSREPGNVHDPYAAAPSKTLSICRLKHALLLCLLLRLLMTEPQRTVDQ